MGLADQPLPGFTHTYRKKTNPLMDDIIKQIEGTMRRIEGLLVRL